MLKPAKNAGFDYKQLVRQGYERCAEQYTQSRQNAVVPELTSLIQRLPPGATVLDIGCGGGLPVTRELAKTCTVTGVDISPAQLALAKQNIASGQFLCGDIMAMTFPRESFDAVVSFYAILHIPKEEHRDLFARIHGWLKLKGLLLASVSIENEEPYTEDDYFGGTMYWSNWGIKEYRQMLVELGFALLEESKVGHGFKDGIETKPEVHPLIYAQKV